MTLEIYHQLGFRYKWSIQSLQEDGAGDGLILAPRSIERKDVERLDADLRRSAIFDPQFFEPRIPKGALDTYPFFPHLIAGGFATVGYADDYANESAQRCVAFQVENEFRFLVIPARHVRGMPAALIEDQTKLFVDPFLKAARCMATHPPILLQLVLNELMISDSIYAGDLLNWVTGMRDIAGIYLIVEVGERRKQLEDPTLLQRMLEFVQILTDNEMAVVLGYLNTEGILLSLASPSIVTMGSYENLRTFNIRTFQTEESNLRGPRARVYIPKLLQWIDHGYLKPIRKVMSQEEPLLEPNKYRVEMFEPDFQWHFSKPALYKHFFMTFSEQIRDIAQYEGADRYHYVKELIEEAIRHHEALQEEGVILAGC